MLCIRSSLAIKYACAAIAIATMGCQPTDESCGQNASCVSSLLSIDACTQGARTINERNVGGVADCSVNFGDITAQSTEQIFFFNSSPLPVALDITIESPIGTAIAGFFLEENPPTVLEPGTVAGVAVTVVPITPGAVVATVEVETDASNIPEGAISIDLLASVLEP